MKDKPHTFIEAAEELHKAGAELFRVFTHAYLPWIEPFLDWLSKKLEHVS